MSLLSWLVNKSTWLKAIELLNIILFTNNHRQDGILQQKKELSKWDRVESLSSGGLKNVESTWRFQQPNTNVAIAENLAFGVQIIVAILQLTVAYQYSSEIQDFNQYLSDFNIATTTKVTIHEDGTEEAEEWKPLETFKYIFNKKTKDYASIVEKSITGVIKVAQALGEIGAMVDQ